MTDTERRPDVTTLTVQLLSAYLANNAVASDDLANLIRTTRSALTDDLQPSPAAAVEETHVPAVTLRKSLASPDHILSLIDGKPYKTLKRHLARHGLTPDSYRKRYNLPAAYPMVAPSFAAKRREIAQQIGLGVRRSPETAKVEPTAQSSSAAQSPVEAGPAKRKAAKTGKPKVASTARSRSKAAADKIPTTVVLEPEAGNEKPLAAKSRNAPRKTAASAKRDTQPARNAKSEAAADGGLSPRAQPPLSGQAKPKPDASASSNKPSRATKHPAGTRAKATAAAGPLLVVEPPANAQPASTEKARPARRGKLGLFRGRAVEPVSDAVNADVIPDAPTGGETARKAPRAKRMARTPARSPK